MYQSLHGIVLGQVKHSDRTAIAHIFTRERGIMSFAVPQGSSRGARQRAAMMMPLSLLRFEASMRPGRALGSMRDVQPALPLVSLRTSPAKAAIAMMIAEVLSRTIHEQESNQPLYDYVAASIGLLEQIEQGVANFHLCFLLHLGTFLGIEPDWGSWQPGRWFDMMGGTFIAAPRGNHCLPPDHAAALALLARMTWANLHLFRFTREQRNQVLDLVLQYYRLHNSTLGSLKSPAVLQQLFI